MSHSNIYIQCQKINFRTNRKLVFKKTYFLFIIIQKNNNINNKIKKRRKGYIFEIEILLLHEWIIMKNCNYSKVYTNSKELLFHFMSLKENFF